MFLLKKTSDGAILSDGYYEMKLLITVNGPLAFNCVYDYITGFFGKRSVCSICKSQ